MVFSCLDDLAPRTPGRILAVELEPALVAWLRAVGLEAGVTVEILRRGIFGGPLHVRTSSGCELAVHRSVARAVRVDRAVAGAPAAAAPVGSASTLATSSAA